MSVAAPSTPALVLCVTKKTICIVTRKRGNHVTDGGLLGLKFVTVITVVTN